MKIKMKIKKENAQYRKADDRFWENTQKESEREREVIGCRERINKKIVEIKGEARLDVLGEK